jgi:hypothetical protein
VGNQRYYNRGSKYQKVDSKANTGADTGMDGVCNDYTDNHGSDESDIVHNYSLLAHLRNNIPPAVEGYRVNTLGKDNKDKGNIAGLMINTGQEIVSKLGIVGKCNDLGYSILYRGIG